MRIAFAIFLAFILTACQPASVPTPAASPTTPGKIQLPTATITLIPTAPQTAIPTQTVSPAILIRRASPICENAFSALVEIRPLLPPFAVLKKETYTDGSSWELSHQLPHLGSVSVTEVQTLFCISETRTQTGTYTDGSAAYQLFWEVRAVSWPGGTVIGKNSFTGSPPSATKVFSSGSAEGAFPYEEFAAWIFNKVDHPEFLYFNDAITSLAISPDGRLAAFGTAITDQVVDKEYQAKIFLVNPSDLQTDFGTSAFRDVLEGHQGMVTSLAFSPDGRILASSGYDLFLKFWDVKTGALLGQISLTDTPNFLAFSPDGSQLAVASNLGLSLLNPVTMQIEQSLPEAGVTSLTFSPEEPYLYVHGSKTIKIIDTNANRVTLEFPNPVTLIPTISAAQDGSVIGVTYETPEAVDGFVLSKNGTQIITYTVSQIAAEASGEENIRLATWEANTGKYLNEIRFNGDSIQTMKLSSDGTLLAMANGNTIWVWNTENWQVVKSFSGHIDLVEDIVFSPDGVNILSASRDGTIRVWSLEE